MPKIKVLCRNPEDYLRETKNDIHKVPRMMDPSQHPFKVEREYIRALNAVKLERTFAKPFIGALDGHRDTVQCLTKHPTSVNIILSGSSDGEIICWSLPGQRSIKRIQAHDGPVNGVAMHPSGKYFFSCGDDQTIKQWSLSSNGFISVQPMNTLLGKCVYTCLDHHWKEDMFVTGGPTVHVWDEHRSEPVRTFPWGTATINHVKYNPVETHLLAATAKDRAILLYDSRAATPLRKVLLKLCTNAISWNPMEAFTFTAANDDFNLYTFDTRKLSQPRNVHVDHTSPVLDVDYSPTGREFVSGSWDKTVRIFLCNSLRSREVYHTKRMQRVGCVEWTRDSKYVISASDEMNIRLWKAVAWEKLGKLAPREKVAANYSEALKTRFGDFPQIRRIKRHRHVPGHVYNAAKQQSEMRKALRRREERHLLNSKPGSVPVVHPHRRCIVTEVK